MPEEHQQQAGQFMYPQDTVIAQQPTERDKPTPPPPTDLVEGIAQPIAFGIRAIIYGFRLIVPSYLKVTRTYGKSIGVATFLAMHMFEPRAHNNSFWALSAYMALGGFVGHYGGEYTLPALAMYHFHWRK